MLRRKATAPRLRGDQGLTLSELLVAMGLTTIAGVMSLSFFVGTNDVNRRTLERGYNSSQARITLDSWITMLRVADPDGLLKITPTKIQFYANLANRDGSGTAAPGAPTLMTLELTDGQLVETRPTGRRIVAQGASASGVLFAPYNGSQAISVTAHDCLSSGAHVEGLCSTNGPDGATTGTTDGATQLDLVTRIDINFSVTDKANLAPTSFTSSIAFGVPG